MQQWEYCELLLAGYAVTFYGRSGQMRHTISEADRDTAIARLGLVGWELVSVTVAGGPGVMSNFYFKRPIQPGRRIDDAL